MGHWNTNMTRLSRWNRASAVYMNVLLCAKMSPPQAKPVSTHQGLRVPCGSSRLMSTSRLARWWFNKVLGCSRFVHNIPHAWSQFPCNFKRRVLINNIFLRLFAKKDRMKPSTSLHNLVCQSFIVCIAWIRPSSPPAKVISLSICKFVAHHSHPPNSKHSQQAPNLFIAPILSHAFDRRFEEGIANWPSFPWGIQARFPSHRAYGVRSIYQ